MTCANKNSVLALTGLALLSFAGTAANALTTGPFTGSVPDTLTTWGVPLGSVTQSITKFNPALGVLDSVSLTLNGDATSTVTVMATTDTTFYYTAGATIRLLRPDGTVLTQVIPTLSVGDAFNPVSLAAGKSDIRTGSTTASSGVQTFTSASDLALFTGLGSIALPTQASGQVTSTLLGGNANAGQSTVAGANVSVIYNYHSNAAVPEPGSVAMLIAGGMTGAGLFVRRRSRK